jgi:hypothetical protein
MYVCMYVSFGKYFYINDLKQKSIVKSASMYGKIDRHCVSKVGFLCTSMLQLTGTGFSEQY